MSRKPKYFDVLERLVAGWRPFPFQLSGIDQYFRRKGFVRAVFDAEGRVVYEPTDAAREAVALGKGGAS